MPSPVTVDPRVSHALGLCAIGAAVAVSWSTQYLPRVRQLQNTHTALMTITQQLDETQHLLTSAGGQEAWMATTQQQIQEIARRLTPSLQVPRLLDHLVATVSANQLTLVNLNQGNLTPATAADGHPLTLGQALCLGLPVTLTLEGRFHAVRTLLEQLRGADVPCLVNVEGVHLVLDDPATGKLTVTIQLVLYVLGS